MVGLKSNSDVCKNPECTCPKIHMSTQMSTAGNSNALRQLQIVRPQFLLQPCKGRMASKTPKSRIMANHLDIEPVQFIRRPRGRQHHEQAMVDWKEEKTVNCMPNLNRREPNMHALSDTNQKYCIALRLMQE